jgi:hypothetical protein
VPASRMSSGAAKSWMARRAPASIETHLSSGSCHVAPADRPARRTLDLFRILEIVQADGPAADANHVKIRACRAAWLLHARPSRWPSAVPRSLSEYSSSRSILEMSGIEGASYAQPHYDSNAHSILLFQRFEYSDRLLVGGRSYLQDPRTLANLAGCMGPPSPAGRPYGHRSRQTSSGEQ